jgi:hypothetical protein
MDNGAENLARRRNSSTENPRSMWSLWVFWDEGMTTHRGWYINIDAPYRQTRFGFDTWDMFLDVVVEPGIFTERETAEVRATAKQTLEIVKSNRPPYDDIWANWRTDVL